VELHMDHCSAIASPPYDDAACSGILHLFCGFVDFLGYRFPGFFNLLACTFCCLINFLASLFRWPLLLATG
jgi:hypothetical protein